MPTTPIRRPPFSPRSVPDSPSTLRNRTPRSTSAQNHAQSLLVPSLPIFTSSPRLAIRWLGAVAGAILIVWLLNNRISSSLHGERAPIRLKYEQPFVNDIVDLPLPGQENDVPYDPVAVKHGHESDASRSRTSRVKGQAKGQHEVGETTALVDGGRVVVTGGGGNIGKHLVRHFLSASIPVTIIDLDFPSSERDGLFDTIPTSRDLLQVALGDVRNTSLLSSALTPDVVGLVHLASISRTHQCALNAADCTDINERGTQLVLDALSAHGTKQGIRPWVVLASSQEVYGGDPAVSPVGENAQRNPRNALGKSLLGMERVAEMHVARVGGDRTKKGMHAVILRLANVFGGLDDDAGKLLPSVVTQALSHLPVQIVGGKQTLDLIHIDDVVEAFMSAVHHLTEKAQANRITKPSMEVFNVGSGETVWMEEMVDTVLHLTRSRSPIQHLPDDGTLPQESLLSISKAEKVLGFRPRIPWRDGLLRYVRAHLVRSRDWLRHEIDTTCYAASPDLEANKRFEKLHQCVVQISVDVRGRLGTLTPEGDNWEIRERFPGVPFESIVGQSDDGKWLLRLKSLAESGNYFGLRPDDGRGPRDVHTGVPPNEILWGAMVDWEVEINPELAAIRLILPNSEFQLAPPTFFGGDFSWVDKNEQIWPFRITPTCCHALPPWPFFAEDPIDHSIELLRTSTVPRFLASIPKGTCERLSKALDKLERDLATLSLDLLDHGIGQRTRNGFPSEWSNAGLPACSNHCDFPTTCIDTGDCQCIYSSCAPRSGRALEKSSQGKTVSYPPQNVPSASRGRNQLLEVVNRSSWLDVLRPHAQRYFAAGTDWPKVHLVALPARLATWRESGEGWDVDLLKEQNCLSADAAMEHAMRLVSVPAEEAEIVFMTHYQDRADWFWDDSWDAMRQSVKGLDPHKVIIPFVHDYGTCRHSTSDVWEVRQSKGRDPDARDVIAWTVAGDVNSPCYKPLQDVVIPPRSCLSSELSHAFGDMSYVRPARQRRTLAGFKGSYWGTGENTRRKVQCKREGSFPPSASSSAKLPRGLQTVWESLGPYPSYLAMLNDSIFCPTPEGIAGWSPRLSEAIYAGCIPVLIGKASQHPFWDMLDWGQMSVTIERKEIQHLEDILMRFSMDDVERMQANLMLVRDAFVYSLDGFHEEQMSKRGPFFFAMHSTKMRLMTSYPEALVVDRPDWV